MRCGTIIFVALVPNFLCCAQKFYYWRYLPDSKGFILNIDQRPSRPFNGCIARIIWNLWQAPAEDPFCILRAGVDTASGRWLAIVVMPECGMDRNSCSDK